MERLTVNHESEVPHLRRIGVIGGFGQWASLDVIERIFRYSAHKIPQYGNRGYPPIDQRWLNKAPMKLNPDGSMPQELEPSEELLEAARYVGQHADFIIIPSNTPHFFKEDIERAARKEVLSIVDVTVSEVERRKYRRVGVMAIGPTLDRRLYQDPLEEKGISVVELPKELSERLDNEGVYPIQEGAKVSEIGGVAYEALDYLRRQSVDGTVLGCTEIPILLRDIAGERDIINPSQLLAEAAVDKAISQN